MSKKDYNILQAQVVHNGQVRTLSHILEMKSCICFETGQSMTLTRRQFRKWMKELKGRYFPQLKLGEYINEKTGKVEKLWGIE